MLGGMDLLGERLEGIVGRARDLGLTQVAPAIDLRRNPMDRAAAFRDAGPPGLADTVQAWEGWQ
jgi:hypothetical protein